MKNLKYLLLANAILDPVYGTNCTLIGAPGQIKRDYIAARDVGNQDAMAQAKLNMILLNQIIIFSSLSELLKVNGKPGAILNIRTHHNSTASALELMLASDDSSRGGSGGASAGSVGGTSGDCAGDDTCDKIYADARG